jgi:hypothetical protein
VRAIDGDGHLLIPETFGTGVTSLSTASAFQGLRFSVPCIKEQAELWEKRISDAKEIFFVRFNEDGSVAERWQLADASVSNAVIEDGSPKWVLKFEARGRYDRIS